jgi:hypothetical protein
MEKKGKGRRTANATTSEIMRDYKRWEGLGSDFALANCAFEAGIGVFEDIKLVVHVFVVGVVIALDSCASKNSRKEEDRCCEGNEMHFDWPRFEVIEELWTKKCRFEGNDNYLWQCWILGTERGMRMLIGDFFSFRGRT